MAASTMSLFRTDMSWRLRKVNRITIWERDGFTLSCSLPITDPFQRLAAQKLVSESELGGVVLNVP